jgi:hypothetical protein
VVPKAASADVVVWNPTLDGKLSYVLDRVLEPALVFWAALLVLHVLRRANAGDPFAPSTVRAMFALGWVLAIGLPATELVHLVSAELALGGSWASIGSAVPTDTMPRFSFAVLLPGLLVLALANVWRYGAQLRETELTTI